MAWKKLGEKVTTKGNAQHPASWSRPCGIPNPQGCMSFVTAFQQDRMMGCHSRWSYEKSVTSAGFFSPVFPLCPSLSLSVSLSLSLSVPLPL